MRTRHGHRQSLPVALAAFAALLIVVLPGCQAAPQADDGPSTPLRTPTAADNPAMSDRAPERGTSTRSGSNIALLIEGNPVTWATLRPLLSEAGGGAVVEDLVLEHALRAELRARGLTVGTSQIESARDSWLALLEDAGVSAEAESEVRRRRGLGDERFRRLLWRNAALRALIDPAEIAVSDREVELARAIRSGRRYLVTGVIARDSATALSIGQRARAAQGSPAGALYAAATARDLTPFRSVISPLDPVYPESIRRALASLPTGAVSSAIALDSGFAVIVTDGVIEGDASAEPNNSSPAAIRRELTIRKTRLAMERLARSFVDRTDVSVLDRSLPR